MDSVIQSIADAMGGLPKEVVVLVISMFPILELRGGLIASALLGLPIEQGILFALIGNIIPIPFILLLITPLFDRLKKTKRIRPLVERLEAKSLGKSDRIRKYEFLGLLLFVGIPLPGTGAWTGGLIASLLNIKLKKAVPAIFLGLLMATAIMCFITYGIPALVKS
ncbi:MAG: small multi-drug export protein [Lachnospiraceae bacterium]|nr:small multi-drug export protein [Lachnospiraceae bacterium]